MKETNFLNNVAVKIAVAAMEGNYEEVLRYKDILDWFICRLIFEAEQERGRI